MWNCLTCSFDLKCKYFKAVYPKVLKSLILKSDRLLSLFALVNFLHTSRSLLIRNWTNCLFWKSHQLKLQDKCGNVLVIDFVKFWLNHFCFFLRKKSSDILIFVKMWWSLSFKFLLRCIFSFNTPRRRQQEIVISDSIPVKIMSMNSNKKLCYIIRWFLMKFGI